MRGVSGSAHPVHADRVEVAAEQERPAAAAAGAAGADEDGGTAGRRLQPLRL